MKPVSKLGADSATPFLPDWATFRKDVLIPQYYLQPLVIRKLAGNRVLPCKFDGKYVMTLPTLNDISDPKYAKKPMVNDIEIDGGIINIYMPQISQTITLDKDEVKLMFAGRSRLPIAINQMLVKFAQREDAIGFLGDSDTEIDGLISGGTDMGNPTGAWGIETDSDGVLSNLQTDIDAIIDKFLVAGYPLNTPIDLVMTSTIYTKIKNTVLSYAPTMTNLDLLKNKLYGGKIYVTNNCQSAAVSGTANTCIAILRHPAAFTLVSSGMEQAQRRTGLWSWRYGLREKFSMKVITPAMIQWYDGISIAQS